MIIALHVYKKVDKKTNYNINYINIILYIIINELYRMSKKVLMSKK